jgi:ParB-like chromosome segregation protein Spo0J
MIFPEMSEADFAALKDDIKEHGQRDPVIVFQNQILDGRHRYRACRELGIEAKTEEFVGDDPVAYVVSKNLKRRHLDTSQRALVAARLANLRDGQRADYALQSAGESPNGAGSSIELPAPLAQDAAAELFNVGVASVKRASAVLKNGVPELTTALDRGDLSVAAAAEVAKLPAEEQRKLVQEGTKALKRKAATIRKHKKRRSPNSLHSKPRAAEPEVLRLIRNVEELVSQLDSMTGFEVMSLEQRNDIGEQLNDLGSILNRCARRYLCIPAEAENTPDGAQEGIRTAATPAI